MKAYFYCDSFYNQELAYHDFVCIAEGLKMLGIKCYGDRNMCKYPTGKYLIVYDHKQSCQDADWIFFHFHMYKNGKKRANRIIRKITQKKQRKYKTVFIDAMDGVRTLGFEHGPRSCDVVLKCHYNKKYKYPKNFVPWQFGVSNRILNAVHPLKFEARENAFLVNFRAKHQLRDYVNENIRPIVLNYLKWDNTIDNIDKEKLRGDDLFYWKQTGGRHFPSYYDRLSVTKSCACYGGVFAIPYGNYNKYTARIARNINKIVPLFKWDRVRQWDSWRLWEAWTAGCCVIHVDLEKYGCVMPVMPRNGVHYIGIDFNNLDGFESIISNPDKMREIADNGRQFVLNYYAPSKIAERLLHLLQNK